jgi:hypothetical protein
VYPRQRWLFKVGCWTAVVTAAIHLAGQLSGGPPPQNDTERQLNELATTYRFAFPGGAQRSFQDLMTGFSLAFSILLSAMGAIGLMVEKRGQSDQPLMSAVARTMAGTGLVMVVISMYYFFIVPTMCLALITICFALASVTPPAPHRD